MIFSNSEKENLLSEAAREKERRSLQSVHNHHKGAIEKAREEMEPTPEPESSTIEGEPYCSMSGAYDNPIISRRDPSSLSAYHEPIFQIKSNER